MKRVLRVGIFGFYSYRNLGDNLMAYLISNAVKERGHYPVIYSKTPGDISDWGYEISGDIEKFTDTLDIIFIGGGGLLIPRPKLSGMGKDFNDDLGRLLEISRERNVPIYGVSLGGTGKDLENIVPDQRRELIRRFEYLTLRNREDLKLLSQANISGEFCDDIVWSTAKKIPVDVKNKVGNRKLRIGFNLYLGTSFKRWPIRSIIWLASKIRKDLEFFFIEIHPGKNSEFEAYVISPLSGNCHKKLLVDVKDACEEIAALDLVITTRLHIGVIAMSYGVPSIAYAAADKTKLLYNRIGRGNLFWRSFDLHKMIRLFFVPAAVESIKSSIERDEGSLDEIVASAMKHYEKIGEILRNHSSDALLVSDS